MQEPQMTTIAVHIHAPYVRLTVGARKVVVLVFGQLVTWWVCVCESLYVCTSRSGSCCVRCKSLKYRLNLVLRFELICC